MTLVDFMEQDLKERRERLAKMAERLAALEKETEATREAVAREVGAVDYATNLLATVKASQEVDTPQQE